MSNTQYRIQVRRVGSLVALLLCIVLLLLAAPAAGIGVAAASPPPCAATGTLLVATQPLGVAASPLLDSLVVRAHASGNPAFPDAVALVQTHDPWGQTRLKDRLTANGYAYTTLAPSQLATTTFANYRVVILNWDDTLPADFATPYAAALPALTTYLNAGGVVYIQAALKGGSVALPLGGTVKYNLRLSNAAPVPADPLLAGLTLPLAANWASHADLAGLPAGARAILVGDGPSRPAGQTADPATLAEIRLPCTSALAVAPASGPYGGTASLSATLTSSGSGVSGKSVAFTLGGTPIGSATSDASGVATLASASLTGLAVGSYPAAIGAAFAGDTDYAATSASGALTVTQAAQTITFPSPGNQTYGGAPVTLAATASSGLAVSYSASGACTVSGSQLTTTGVGSCTVTANQAGNASYAAATPVAYTVSVAPASTTTTVPAASATYGSATATLVATVTSGVGTVNEGTVTFTVKQGTTTVGTASGIAVSAGSASTSFALTGLNAGSYTVAASYVPAASAPTFAASTAATPGTLTLNKAATATDAANASGTGGGSTTLSATVTSAAGTVNDGTVTFTVKQGATTIGTATSGTVTGGAASANFSLSGIAAGSYTIAATYNGGTNFATGSDPTPATLTVNGTSTTTTPAAASAIYSAANVALTATITSTGGTVSGGTVTFVVKQGATTIGTVTSGTVAGGAASATFTLGTGINVGSYTIQATYSGSASFLTSTGSATLTVSKANTAFSTARADSTYGESTATLTARLQRSNGDGAWIAGATVTFKFNNVTVCGGGGQPACPVTDANGWATLTGIAVSATQNGGTYNNLGKANYAGNANHNAAAEQSGAHVVARRILWVHSIDRTVGYQQPNPSTTPPANCLASQTATAACWLELANGTTFINGDTWSSLNLTSLRFAYSRNYPENNASEYVGKTYKIAAVGVSSTNYEVHYQLGILTVVP